jgi:methionine synthase II (cobalamin-independent)
VAPLSRRESLAVEELRFVRKLTRKPVKVTLPGPYLLTRAMWVGPLSRGAYGDKAEMGEDIVRILQDELVELAEENCDFVQFDEPVLTEIVMSEECGRRTFM